VIIDQTLALQEITNALVKHGREKHREFCDKLNQAIVKVSFAAGGFLTLMELAVVPKEEEFIVKLIASCQDIMMAAMGFDKVEEDKDGSIVS
jgi:hypothetical protein